MYVKVGGKKHKIVNYSHDPRSLALHFDAPVKDIKKLCGEPVMVMCEPETPVGVNLPVPQKLVRVVYHFEAMSGEDIALAERMAEKDRELVDMRAALEALKGKTVEGVTLKC